MCVLPYKYRKILEMLLKLMKSCEITGVRHLSAAPRFAPSNHNCHKHTALSDQGMVRHGRHKHTALSDEGMVRHGRHKHTALSDQGMVRHGRHKHTALSDQSDRSAYALHGAYYLKDRDSRPKCVVPVHIMLAHRLVLMLQRYGALMLHAGTLVTW